MDESALASLAAILWDERREMERLLYCLVSQQLVLTSGQTRWLGHADTDINAALATFRDAEVLRAIEVASIASKLDVSGDVSLAELAELAPEPWSMTLRDHRAALRSLAAEIDTTVAENRRLLKAGAQAIGETLARIGSFSSTYDARGESVHRGGGPSLLDEQA
ncbi:MAG: hypothetical protein BGO26_16060 [Actinobacteria bacterium 69-20]|jgi:hypothetical protein|nr:flagellar export chaperone FlgN [Actinomycetota bacterium]OJV28801.1 MAG: hypothetical protein BGO26_16060 [Actinobacteria bacterium 69-20]